MLNNLSLKQEIESAPKLNSKYVRLILLFWSKGDLQFCVLNMCLLKCYISVIEYVYKPFINNLFADCCLKAGVEQ